MEAVRGRIFLLTSYFFVSSKLPVVYSSSQCADPQEENNSVLLHQIHIYMLSLQHNIYNLCVILVGGASVLSVMSK